MSAPATAVAEQLAADTSFVRVVTVANDFQSVVYNKLRDAHSQTVRKKNHETVRRLLMCNQQDSVVKGIKLLGFTDLRAYLVSLNKLVLANKQLQAKGIILNNLAPAALAQAYHIASQRSQHVYPPIKAQSASSKAGSATYKTSAYGICELCFLNNCDECGEFGGVDTQLEQPSNDKGGSGGNPCYDRARVNRESDVAIATVGMGTALLACGVTAGEIATGTTVITIETGPFAPVIGGGVGGFMLQHVLAQYLLYTRLRLTKLRLIIKKHWRNAITSYVLFKKYLLACSLAALLYCAGDARILAVH